MFAVFFSSLVLSGGLYLACLSPEVLALAQAHPVFTAGQAFLVFFFAGMCSHVCNHISDEEDRS